MKSTATKLKNDYQNWLLTSTADSLSASYRQVIRHNGLADRCALIACPICSTKSSAEIIFSNYMQPTITKYNNGQADRCTNF